MGIGSFSIKIFGTVGGSDVVFDEISSAGDRKSALICNSNVIRIEGEKLLVVVEEVHLLRKDVLLNMEQAE